MLNQKELISSKEEILKPLRVVRESLEQSQNENIASVIISGPGKHDSLSKCEIAERLHDEIKSLTKNKDNVLIDTHVKSYYKDILNEYFFGELCW